MAPSSVFITDFCMCCVCAARRHLLGVAEADLLARAGRQHGLRDAPHQGEEPRHVDDVVPARGQPSWVVHTSGGSSIHVVHSKEVRSTFYVASVLSPRLYDGTMHGEGG